MGSSAPDFVATTTSSASSKGIHISSLKCLLRRPETLRATPQIRNIHVVDIHSSSIHSAVTERILGLSDFCRLTPAACLTKLHLRLSDIFGADFLPIPHSPNVTVFTPSFRKFLRSTLSSLDTVVFAYQFPPLRAWTGLSPVRECPCWAYKMWTWSSCTFNSLISQPSRWENISIHFVTSFLISPFNIRKRYFGHHTIW